MGSQRVGHDWVTELNWTELVSVLSTSSSSGGSSGSPNKEDPARPTRQALPSSEKSAQVTCFQPWGYHHSTPKHTRTWETGLTDFHKAQHILPTWGWIFRHKKSPLCPYLCSKHTVDWVENPHWPQTPTRDSHALTSNDLPDLKSTRTFVSTCLRYPFLVDAKVLRGGVQKNVAIVRVFAIP